MAQETGEFLNSYLKEKHYEDVIIVSSPYIRTLQTASHVALACGVKEVILNYHLGEALYTYLHHKNPLPLLLINTKPRDYIENQFMLGVKYKEIEENEEAKTFMYT